ncbi:uncharacterized protein BCR38DRAFT_489706 [Pseudomassariella vexata]|uniref:Secreted protein n=1 Tax=Pseudomassariella vexata TaxID=1141098 RepID=A0A1Y2DGJ1_9PEZI|nr:uncharacterized protein BCR38DRAFT_489706 [Pseudomassariella vexata]ORY58236.1 hypothetical protein BCR38DRAFT_489706 [Pseudomassariella vexata]
MISPRVIVTFCLLSTALGAPFVPGLPRPAKPHIEVTPVIPEFHRGRLFALFHDRFTLPENPPVDVTPVHSVRRGGLDALIDPEVNIVTRVTKETQDGKKKQKERDEVMQRAVTPNKLDLDAPDERRNSHVDSAKLSARKLSQKVTQHRKTKASNLKNFTFKKVPVNKLQRVSSVPAPGFKCGDIGVGPCRKGGRLYPE